MDNNNKVTKIRANVIGVLDKTTFYFELNGGEVIEISSDPVQYIYNREEYL